MVSLLAIVTCRKTDALLHSKDTVQKDDNDERCCKERVVNGGLGEHNVVCLKVDWVNDKSSILCQRNGRCEETKGHEGGK